MMVTNSMVSGACLSYCSGPKVSKANEEEKRGKGELRAFIYL